MSKDYFQRSPLLRLMPEPERTEVVTLIGEVYEAGKRDCYAAILETLPEEDLELLRQKLAEQDALDMERRN